ncbi:MAG: TolC family protein [Acidobacteria bacterium]|jgi:outer membrane protein TolC|nr:TolC family protein [Acidobacteriota bacterium]
MKRIALGLALLALGIVQPAAAADPIPGAVPAPSGSVLTLDEAVATALERNPLLRVADAGVGAAQAQVDEARSYRLPKAQLSEFASRSTNPVVVFSDLLTQERFGPANFAPSFLNEPPPTNNWNTKLAVMQPIWTGGKIAGGVAAAELGAAAAAADRDSARQQVSQKVIEAYSGAVLAESYRRVAGEALSTAEAHVRLVKDMVETGMVVRSDLLQAEVKEYESRDMLIRAESQAAVARAGLNMAMGQPLDDVVTLPESVDVPTLTERDLPALTDEALAVRPDLKAAAARAGAAEKMVKVAKAGWYPEIGVGGAYEANAEDFIGADGTNWTIMGTVTWDILGGFSTGPRVRRASEQQRQAEEYAEHLRQMAGLEVRQAFYDLRAARESLAQAAKAVESARASLVIVEDRYKEGLTTLVELLVGQTALTAARTREVSARRDMLLADARLKLAIGRL